MKNIKGNILVSILCVLIVVVLVFCGVSGGTLDTVFVSLLSTSFIWIVIGLFIGAVFLCFKLKDIVEYCGRKTLYKKLEVGLAEAPDCELKTLFSLSSKEILVGEGVLSSTGKEQKKLSSIKDAPTRLAAENSAELSFCISHDKVYKVLKIHSLETKYYYEITFSELNRFLQMNSSAYDKYKKITEANYLN